ncbi:MAG: TonB-dependent receptor [Ramlibacter sp.]|nr:TonB-dependent receptor [Ramlibacter sp.]
MRLRLALAAVAGAIAAGAQAQVVHTLPPVEVIQQMPLPGFEIPRALYPGNAQQAGAAGMREAGAGTLPEFMNRRLVGVTASEVQGSPFQVDISYRGQRLSPLLGAPQGLSLYLDGVRMNQPFGDVVSWDLLPEAALAGLALVPGSNPLYGLNTLAGALVLTTKSGRTHPGTEAELSLGQDQRKRLDFAHGQRWASGWHAFAAGTGFDEPGWRDRSPGRLANLFLKAGRTQGDTDWSLSLLQAGSELTGNGLVNESLLALDRRAVYTAPDRTRSRDTLLNFQGSQELASDGTLALQAWYRRSGRDGSNGDVADAGDEAPARFHDARLRQWESGVSTQWTRRRGALGFALGAEAATSRLQHDQYGQDAQFDAGRNVLPEPGSQQVHEVALRGRSTRASLFASGLLALSPHTQLSPSLRWNGVRVANTLGQPAPAGTEEFRYGALNPALGLTHAATDTLTLFASAGQGNRVPTALELGCADPARPCVLPTGLQADPFLRQVVSRTLEAGVRGQGAGVQWSAALFRTVNRDDIVFARSGVSQAGYFTNVDRTRRRGLELAAQGRQGRWDWHLGYTALAATYQATGVLPGPLSTVAQPNAFQPGTRIAGLPRQVLKLAADWQALPELKLGADLLAQSSQGVAGNESGNRPELGSLAGYALLHARATWRLGPRWQAYLRINNLFDRRYASAAAGNLDLFPGGQALAPGAEPQAARFLAPGAPRYALIGVRYAWEP